MGEAAAYVDAVARILELAAGLRASSSATRRAASRIQSADAASRMLIFELPARRFSNRIGVSPIRQPTVWHQYRISS